MPWVKLDDDFTDHPKIANAGPLAAWLYVCGLTYSARFLTDGFIPAAKVRQLADVDNAAEFAERLVNAGLWEHRDEGFLVSAHPPWKVSGDNTTQTLRRTPAHSTWRDAVLCRDGYACQTCGATEDLHAHHIQAWARFPEIRFSVENGQTLCKACHQVEHSRAYS